MDEYISNITYNGNSFKARVAVAKDLANDSKLLPLLIKFDIELRKDGKNKNIYDVIHAHGGEQYIFDGDDPIIKKDVASNIYDVAVSCNNNLWMPDKYSKLGRGVYALGMIGGTGLFLRNKKNLEDGIPDSKLYVSCLDDDVLMSYHQNPNGKKIIVAGKPYHFISFEGNQDPKHPMQWTKKGIEFFKINDLVDKSREIS